MPPGQNDSPEATLGAALRAAREQAGLSVEQVAADTRIRATLIRDLESDRFTSSGGSVYARGHVKSIASTLRIDPAALLALFDEAEGAPAEQAIAEAEPLPRSAGTFGGSDFAAASAAALRPERRGPRWGLALGGAAVTLAVLIGVGTLQGSKPAANDQALPPAPTASPTASPTPVVQAPDVTASKPPVVGAQLRVRVIGGNSWVSISNPSTTLFEGVLKDGEFRDYQDGTRLRVIVGNAAAVNLNCGGTDSGSAGASGAVRRFECTSGGLKSL